jgi:hypothetical protein
MPRGFGKWWTTAPSDLARSDGGPTATSDRRTGLCPPRDAEATVILTGGGLTMHCISLKNAQHMPMPTSAEGPR